MRILLVNPYNAGGHHDEYKRLLSKAFTDLGHNVIHFIHRYEKTDSISNPVPETSAKAGILSDFYYKYYKYSRTFWLIRRQAIDKWQILFNHIVNLEETSNKPDLIFFECLDGYTGQYITKDFLDKHLTIRFSGIYISPKDTRVLTKRHFRKGVFDPNNILKSKCCISIGVLMDEAIPFLSMLIHKPVIELPDVVSVAGSIQDNSMGELIRKRAGSRFKIGIWGSIEQRKGVREFLSLFENSPEEKIYFVMGGQINLTGWTDSDKDLLQQSTSGEIENLLIVDHWLTDDELLSGMASCDLIFAAYPGWQFSSGIIGKAAAVKVPILVNDGFVMAKRVRDFNLGFVKQEHEDVSEWIAENIVPIKNLNSSPSFNEGCIKYCDKNDYFSWKQSLARMIEPQKL